MPPYARLDRRMWTYVTEEADFAAWSLARVKSQANVVARPEVAQASADGACMHAHYGICHFRGTLSAEQMYRTGTNRGTYALLVRTLGS